MGSPISPFATFSARAGDGTAGTAVAVIRVLLALAPVALPAAYLVFLKRELAKHTIADGVRTSPPDPLLPISTSSASTKTDVDDDDDNDVDDDNYADDVIPPDVLASPERFVVSRERVTSRAIPVGSLRRDLLAVDVDTDSLDDDLLEAYLSATMRAFSWTPQALLMARMGTSVDDAAGFARSFRAEYLQDRVFQAGDRLCGVYVVRSWRGGKAVLDLAPPRGWRGPVVRGALGVGFEWERDGDGDGDGSVRFVNETVLWRGVEEKGTMLEGWVGRWMHGLLAGWLVVKGVEAVTD
ncbi:hypothetical protein F4820DRAFT_471272 [Hypoxylon rubiginosum]|uniref:Uncharacterized protein n=1 Tax=Hypoxylon rubiginosum TaxID=110542 RepID=A0ACB9ZDJ6_9PEZI|nr:hypothetical protein F4820DRAFT_471272 [Hypoxylon rubiginosum]